MTSTAASLEDDDDLLQLPHAEGDDGEVGVADADELLVNDLADDPEDVGLDSDPLGGGDGSEVIDEGDEEAAGLLDDTPLEVEPEIDSVGEEHGWTDDNEASDETWEHELPDELPGQGGDDDLGEEGVDDPLLDALPPDERSELPLTEDETADEEDDAWAEELPEELASSAGRAASV